MLLLHAACHSASLPHICPCWDRQQYRCLHQFAATLLCWMKTKPATCCSLSLAFSFVVLPTATVPLTRRQEQRALGTRFLGLWRYHHAFVKFSVGVQFSTQQKDLYLFLSICPRACRGKVLAAVPGMVDRARHVVLTNSIHSLVVYF